ncbi:hypothetical protein SEA_SCHMIDT_75 [Gordonia phage Schmidt]|uniref:Uncharacterized protein n=1 Tax=Gordonia phage Schmidt TaxID=2301697 RepID=A0A385E0I6_9CAUD|nr:hypothetical protein KDJ59_gp75 [Gordonia phage Schmidt]AXQ65194.1 hypothetical protein SEA_SCHMIDT_75 [Gordonia phage Schmidt]
MTENRCTFCWEVAEVLAEANECDPRDEYGVLHEHAHKPKRHLRVMDGGAL